MLLVYAIWYPRAAELEVNIQYQYILITWSVWYDVLYQQILASGWCLFRFFLCIVGCMVRWIDG